MYPTNSIKQINYYYHNYKKYFTFIKCFSSSSYLLGNKTTENKNNTYDVVVLGGGIVGTAIAREISEVYRNISVALLEKESCLAKHQSCHNSGVVHAGIYYKINSLKAKLCIPGAQLVLNYCEEKNIPYLKCGKIIVATDEKELCKLNEFYERGMSNNVPGLMMLNNQREIIQFGPICKGIRALWSPNTANVNWATITQNFGNDLLQNNGKIIYNFEVKEIKEADDCNYPVLIKSEDSSVIKTKYLITCAGLQSDQISKMIGSKHDEKIVSFKVDYLDLKGNKYDNTKYNIFAVNLLDLPFLGIHLSPRVDGTIICGPTAVPALQIEGYENDQINVTYLNNTLAYCGFRKMVGKYFMECIHQFSKTMCIQTQVNEFQKIIPSISYNDVQPGRTAVQAQLIDLNGNFVDDFQFEICDGPGIRKRIINCKFMPSPAATCSMSIAKYVVDGLSKHYDISSN